MTDIIVLTIPANGILQHIKYLTPYKSTHHSGPYITLITRKAIKNPTLFTGEKVSPRLKVRRIRKHYFDPENIMY